MDQCPKKNVQIVLMNYGLKMLTRFPTIKKNENFHQAKYGKKRQKKGEKKINNQSIYSKAILFYDDDDD